MHSISSFACLDLSFNPLSANFTKWSNRLKQFVGFCLSVFGHFVGLALKGLRHLKFLTSKFPCGTLFLVKIDFILVQEKFISASTPLVEK